MKIESENKTKKGLQSLLQCDVNRIAIKNPLISTEGALTLPTSKVVTAGICITKAMNRPLAAL